MVNFINPELFLRHRLSGATKEILSALRSPVAFLCIEFANAASRRASNWPRAERFGIRASRSGTRASYRGRAPVCVTRVTAAGLEYG